MQVEFFGVPKDPILDVGYRAWARLEDESLAAAAAGMGWDGVSR